MILLDDQTVRLLRDVLTGTLQQPLEPHIKTALTTLRGRLEESIAEETDPIHQWYRDTAWGHTREGEIEVDEGAIVSIGDDDGAYVQAWLWVPGTPVKVEEEVTFSP